MKYIFTSENMAQLIFYVFNMTIAAFSLCKFTDDRSVNLRINRTIERVRIEMNIATAKRVLVRLYALLNRLLLFYRNEHLNEANP